MQELPLQPVPAQTLSATLSSGQEIGISLYTLNDAGDVLQGIAETADTTLITADSTTVTADATSSVSPLSLAPTPWVYMDLTLDGATVFTAKLCLVLSPLLITSQYLGFEGELLFYDTLNTGLQDSEQVAYTGLGSQFTLVYLSPADIASLQQAAA